MRSRTERRRRETQSRRGRNPRNPPAEEGRRPAATIFSCRSNGPKAGIVTTGGSAAKRWRPVGSELESWSATGASGARQINRRLPRTSLSEAKGELERNGRQRRPTNQQRSPANEPERSERRVGAGDGLRTRYLDLGKVALYQVSYSRSGRGEMITRPVRPATRGPLSAKLPSPLAGQE